ncbi:MAG: metal ABC transporter permease [Candidatus Atribacteria bacterium]|jgi:zinc transport system permease protein|nr:metal ABC transporter permease [Candidatus Atribacteria bacterium]
MFELLQYEFIRNALLAVLLASIACGIIGVYVVVKRIVFISGGIAHASFGGVGLGYFLGVNPIWGIIPFSILSALVMGLVSKRTRIPEDTAIGILWALGVSLGIVFIGLSPGYAPDLFSYLFGNILTVTSVDLIIMLILDLVIIMVVFLFYKEFLALSFDDEFATVVGVPTVKLYFLLLCLIALTIVVLMKVVGIIMIIALLTIPAAISKQYTSNLKKMIFISILLSAIFGLGGLWLSYQLNLASGATIVIVSGIGFILSWFGKQGRILQV